jgi:dephospho-CoA kinase
VPSGPAVLVPHDPRWATLAAERLTELRRALAPLVDVDACTFDHIGSTAVPGLAAKASIDLQVRVPALPPPAALDAALAPLGWVPAPGSRSDSPGVVRDLPAPGDTEPVEVWAKRLYTSTDRVRPAILHVRLSASPFGRRTVAFRDRLRAEPDLRAAYEQLKRRLAAAHASDADYDDYTRGKSAFIRAATSR